MSQQSVYETLEKSDKPLTALQIADIEDIHINNIRKSLRTLRRNGHVAITTEVASRRGGVRYIYRIIR